MIRFFIWIVFLLPVFYLIFGILTEISPEPVKFIYTITGVSSLVILMLSLSISPLKRVFKINLLKYRRLVGLFAFFYALLHFINFALLDAELDMTFIIKESIEKPFIFAGSALFVILLFMALTSTRFLFKKFAKYHKIVYVGLILGIAHFSLAQKVLEAPQYIAMFIGALLLLERMKKR